MLARVAMIQGKPEKVEEVVRYFKEQTLVNAKKVNGFKQAFMMVNRQNGKIVAMVHWENQQAIQDSMPIASKAIPKMKELSGATQDAMVDVYEVAVSEVPVAVGKK
jgi:heme-degrading monooxygenase HmoA